MDGPIDKFKEFVQNQRELTLSQIASKLIPVYWIRVHYIGLVTRTFGNKS